MKHPLRAISSSTSVRHPHGFTLLELLVVVLIIGLLTGIVAPRFLGTIGRSEITTANAQIDSFVKALEAYRLDMGRFPDTDPGLNALIQSPGNDPRWRGPYLKKGIPVDPWGTPYQYRSPGGNGRDYDVLSSGRDRAPGGVGDDADLTN